MPRCSLERDDSTQFRLDEIYRIIEQCRYAIHDISRMEPDLKTNLPRFNMPLELGVFLGVRRFGPSLQKKKQCMILERKPYRYQKSTSDLAGQNIHVHKNQPQLAVLEVRNWLRTIRRIKRCGPEIWFRYMRFRRDLPKICKRLKMFPEDLTYVDLCSVIVDWQRENP